MSQIQGLTIREETTEYVTEDGQLKEKKLPPFIKMDVTFRESLSLLSDASLSVFICIALHINEKSESFPSYETIMAETGYSNRSTIKRALDKLAGLSLIQITPGGGRGKPNTYQIKRFMSYGKSPKSGQNRGGETVQSVNKQSVSQQETVHLVRREEEPIRRTNKKKNQGGGFAPRHPAVQAYTDGAKWNASPPQAEEIIKIVGEEPNDIEFWYSVARAYVLAGWNRSNVGAMLDYYQRRELPGTKQNRSTSKTARNMQLLKEVMEDRERGETE